MNDNPAPAAFNAEADRENRALASLRLRDEGGRAAVHEHDGTEKYAHPEVTFATLTLKQEDRQ